MVLETFWAKRRVDQTLHVSDPKPYRHQISSVVMSHNFRSGLGLIPRTFLYQKALSQWSSREDLSPPHLTCELPRGIDSILLQFSYRDRLDFPLVVDPAAMRRRAGVAIGGHHTPAAPARPFSIQNINQRFCACVSIAVLSLSRQKSDVSNVELKGQKVGVCRKGSYQRVGLRAERPFTPCRAWVLRRRIMWVSVRVCCC